MPPLDWNVFGDLPGAPWRNFELLCHALVKRNYGRFGSLVSVRGQPVVEFHLQLHTDCPALGEAGRWFGWQCKWWDPPGRLNSSRKGVIRKALENQPVHLPGLTDWVLWTRDPLSKNDWRWILDEQPDVRVHTWHGDDIAELLAGDAEVLRSVYFGDLILTPDKLRRAYDESSATLRDRYLPQLHTTVREQRSLGSLAGLPAEWAVIARSTTRVDTALQAFDEVSVNPPDGVTEYAAVTTQLRANAEELVNRGRATAERLQARRPEQAIEAASQAKDVSIVSVVDLVELLMDRDVRDHSEAIRALHDAATELQTSLARLARTLRLPLVAALGAAGSGKTHLAASLASPTDDRPAGVLVPARAFRGRTIALDDLASVAGLESMPIDDLLEGLEGAGARAGARLPFVIDGLNESASAAAWADVLARLQTKVARLDHVYVVVTLRESYRARCLPTETPALSVRGFPIEWPVACRRYFEAYKIRADMAALPVERFADPLFLRIFCDATNSLDATEWVELGNIPPQLIPVLQRYVDKAIERIQDRLEVDPAGVRSRLRALAREWWTERTREIPFEDAKETVGDDPLALDRSLALAFEDENLLDRDVGGDTEQVGPMWDALGGFLIADAITEAVIGPDGLLGDDVEARLAGQDVHPLAEDVRQALGDLLVRRRGVRLEAAARGNELKRQATLDLVQADAAVIDIDAASRLSEALAKGADIGLAGWTAVFRNAAVKAHPLNADWLDQTLAGLATADRDLTWSEWVRANDDLLIDRIVDLARRWREERFEPDDELEAKWLTWVLTTTDRALRDRATESLYWFGRVRPDLLHARTLELLGLNDPYVPERLLAASYGVAMANHFASPQWRQSVVSFLAQLDREMLSLTARRPTAHWLMREYAVGIHELVRRLHADILPDREQLTQSGPPLPEGDVPRLKDDDPHAEEMRETVSMDFGNYTLGRLFDDRANYDMEHAGHRQLIGEVLARVWDLGWRAQRFSALDREIGRLSFTRDHDPEKVERYGKKYGWIAFYEAAGRRAAAGQLKDDRLADVDIDPSLPEPARPAPIKTKSWVRTRHRTDARWIETGKVDVPDDLLRPDTLEGDAGPWVCLDGFLIVRDRELHRRVFTFIWSAFVHDGQWQDFAASVAKGSVGRHTMPEAASDYYTFGGEIPWSDLFAADLYLDFDRGVPLESYTLDDGTSIELEGTAHLYAWESYHSVVNRAGGEGVPSRELCRALDLRGRPQTFDLYEPSGAVASKSFSAPPPFESGHLVYLREDLVERWESEHKKELGWVVWGERELIFEDISEHPEWYSDLRRAGKDQHRRVVSLTALASPS